MLSKFRSKASASPHYRADIDGLRAVAVLSVVFFHAHLPHFNGGYIGVDIFFVISGYLITTIINKEMERGSFTFLGFYERRVRRIFPALFVVLIACAVVGMVIFPVQQMVEYGRSMLAALGFSSNIYFDLTAHGSGYFLNLTGTQYLLHTWSLSVEEQFYLLFPVFLLCLHKFAKPLKRALVLAVAVCSLLICAHWIHTRPIADFYMMPSRAWEFLLGSLLALKALPPLRNVWLRQLAALLGLAAIVYAVITFNEFTLFPGLAALYPCLGTALVIYAGEDGRSVVKSVLSLPPLVFVGVISYSLYLWHWPMIGWTKFVDPSYYVPWQRQVPGMLIALGLSILTFRYVETPFRLRAHRSSAGHRAVWVGLAASAILACGAVAMVATGGLPQRYNPTKTAELAANYAHKSEVPDMGACANWHTDPTREGDVDFCSFGANRSNVLFWGDSHVTQIYPLIREMHDAGQFSGRGVVFAVGGGCSLGTSFNMASPGYHCDAVGRFAMKRAEQSDIDTVFFIFSPWWTYDGATCAVKDGHCAEVLTGQEVWERTLLEMRERITTLQKLGKRVILTVPFPIYAHTIPEVEIRNLVLKPFGVAPLVPTQYIPKQQRDDIINLAKQTGAILYNPRDVLCKGELCTYAEHNESLYSDQSHMATSQIGRLRPGMAAVLAQSLLPRPTTVQPHR